MTVDRIASEALAEKEIEHWETIPSKPGMGLDDDNLAKLRAGVPPGKKISTDAKAYDFHVAEWQMMLAADVEVG